MKKNDTRKRRDEFVYAKTRDIVDHIEVFFDSETGNFGFVTPVVDAYTEVSYERTSGDKVIARVPGQAQSVPLDLDRAIEQFDVLFAIDTNSRVVEGRTISVTGIIEATRVFSCNTAGQIRPAWRYTTPICYGFGDPTDDPERIGWCLGLQYVYSAPLYDRYPKIGVIVDAHLGEHAAYNSRRKPIVGNTLLPLRATLIYAAADTGGEYFANQMLRNADKVASRCMAKILLGPKAIGTNKHPRWAFSGLTKIYSTRGAAPAER